MLKGRTIALVILVLLAGCSGTLQETTPTSTTTETTTSPIEIATTTTTVPATTEETTTMTVEEEVVDNPWEKQNVTVAVQNSINQSRDITPLVNQTLTYWNSNASMYAKYNVTFLPTTNTREADIIVNYVARITKCGVGGNLDSTVGCAPILTPSSTPTDPVEVDIVAGYSNESTTQILKHEFGHVLGINHGEEPMPTMQAISRVTYLSQTDLVDRPVPWRNSTLSVFVDVSSLPGHDQDAAREQIQYALDYYEAGAGGAVPSNVSFVQTSNRSAADIRINFSDDSFECGGERLQEGSCGVSWVYNTDTDDAPEYYADYEIKLRGLDMDTVGWHVGYWLADTMGLSKNELPDPFVDADYDDRRDEWWETESE